MPRHCRQLPAMSAGARSLHLRPLWLSTERVASLTYLPTSPTCQTPSETHSVELSTALLKRLGVPDSKIAQPDPGNELEEAIIRHLKPLRPDLRIERGRRAPEFIQYAHLDVFPIFQKNVPRLATDSCTSSTNAFGRLNWAERGFASKTTWTSSSTSTDYAGGDGHLTWPNRCLTESLLKIDVSVAIPHEGELDELAIALSSKWSLRIDRAQDCVSQGSKLVAQRRGRMPHFGVITIEPRPSHVADSGRWLRGRRLRVSPRSFRVVRLDHRVAERKPSILVTGADLQPPHEAETSSGLRRAGTRGNACARQVRRLTARTPWSPQTPPRELESVKRRLPRWLVITLKVVLAVAAALLLVLQILLSLQVYKKPEWLPIAVVAVVAIGTLITNTVGVFQAATEAANLSRERGYTRRAVAAAALTANSTSIDVLTIGVSVFKS